MAKKTPPSTNHREALKRQRLAEAKRARTQRIVIIAAAIVLAAIIATVAIALVQHNAKKDSQPSEGQIVPPNAVADHSAIVYQSKGKTADASAPVVRTYVDFQCPGCALASQYVDPNLEALADEGKITLEFQILHGLDRMLNTQYSQHAAVGAACADVHGKFPEYTAAVFAAQPAHEGDGWTDEQLYSDLAKQAGIEDLDAFSRCATGQQTSEFVASMQAKLPDNIQSTPSFSVNGKLATFSDKATADKDALFEEIAKAA